LACLQVVINHATQAFWPEFPTLNPFCRFLSDGGVAVCVFFLLSGTVLTYAYEQAPAEIGRHAVRRVIRLGIPLLGACLVGFVLRIAGDAGLRAAALHAAWLARQVAPITVGGALLDGTVRAVTGYADTTLFAPLAGWLPVANRAVDEPIWSLHVELWGSAMMLLVAGSAAWGVWARRAVFAGLAVLCGLTPIVLFLVGAAVAGIARRGVDRPVLGVALLAAGIAASAFHAAPGLYAVARVLDAGEMLRPERFFSLSSLVAALGIYGGVLLIGAARRGLAVAPLRWLGRLSFSIYLLHEPVLLSLGVAGLRLGGPALALGVTALATIAGAVVFARVVDEPARKQFFFEKKNQYRDSLSCRFWLAARCDSDSRCGHAPRSFPVG
jgi:peptidoglycan/LPS O-acetylase OafA/YrhL